MRRALAVLALLVLAAFAPGQGRDLVLFLADFNPPADPSAPAEFLAKGGDIAVQGPPDVFSVALTSAQQGVLKVSDNPFNMGAVLVATLDEPAESAVLDVSLDMKTVAGLSDLIVSIADDDGGEMIDIEFDEADDGLIVVGGVEKPFGPGGSDPAGGSFHVQVHFVEHMFGIRSWKLTLTGSFGVKQFAGFVPGFGTLSVGKLRVVRPGGTRGGSWVLDNLKVTTPDDPTLTNNP